MTATAAAVAVGGSGGGRRWQLKSRVAAIVVDQFDYTVHSVAAPGVYELATFGAKLSNFLESLYLHRSRKEMDNWPSICATKKYTNREWSLCMCICILGQQKHLFYKTNTQMHHFKVQPLQQHSAPSFAFLCICVLG
jgi:hypothetical protein